MSPHAESQGAKLRIGRPAVQSPRNVPRDEGSFLDSSSVCSERAVPQLHPTRALLWPGMNINELPRHIVGCFRGVVSVRVYRMS